MGYEGGMFRPVGDTPAGVDRETSAALARRIRAQRRRCWRNAALAIPHLGNSALYVEGWVVVERQNPLVVEHGWCEVDGRIIDTTYTPYVSSLSEPLAYYGGFSLTAREAQLGFRQRTLPISWLLNDPQYLAAFTDAFRDAKRRQTNREPRRRTVVAHCLREPYDVFIGRPSKWGNPYRMGPDGTREQVVGRFRQWLIRKPTLLRDLESLRGQVLGCRCAPELCHGDVLAELADLGLPTLPDPARADRPREAETRELDRSDSSPW